MRLIQAKVSDEQFKAFSHYLVDRDLTVAEAIVEWIEREVVERDTAGRARGKRGLRAVEADDSKAVQVSNPALPTTPPVKTLPVPVSSPKQPVSEFLCKVCGKPTKGEFLCPTCKKA